MIVSNFLIYFQVALKDGLEKTIEYFRRELERAHHSQRNVFVPQSNDIGLSD